MKRDFQDVVSVVFVNALLAVGARAATITHTVSPGSVQSAVFSQRDIAPMVVANAAEGYSISNPRVDSVNGVVIWSAAGGGATATYSGSSSVGGDYTWTVAVLKGDLSVPGAGGAPGPTPEYTINAYECAVDVVLVWGFSQGASMEIEISVWGMCGEPMGNLTGSITPKMMCSPQTVPISQSPAPNVWTEFAEVTY